MDATRLSDADLLDMEVALHYRIDAMEQRAARLVVEALGLRTKRGQLISELHRRRRAA